MVSGLIEFSERSEQFLPYGRIDKIIGDQRELKEWGFLALLLFLYGRPIKATAVGSLRSPGARGTRSLFTACGRSPCMLFALLLA